MTDNTMKGPMLTKMFLVAMGAGSWSPSDQKWLDKHPKYREFANDLKAAARKHEVAGIFSAREIMALSNDPQWSSIANRLEEIFDRTSEDKNVECEGFQEREARKQQNKHSLKLD